MGFLDRVSSLFKRTVPESDSYKQYKQCLNVNLGDKKRFEQYIAQYKGKLDQLKVEGATIESPVYKSVSDELSRFKYSLYEAEKTTKFIRENTPEDIEYRKELLNSFVDKLKEVVPNNLGLRFHGTPIYFAEEILKSGRISSSADRFEGFMSSSDNSGEISVSDINSLYRTVNYYLDVSSYQRCLPCGCLFVLNSDGQTLEQHAASVMNSVDFKKEPDRLCAVISTPENIQNVQEWLREGGLSPDLAFTFDGFIPEIEKNVSSNIVGQENEKPPIDSVICSCERIRNNNDFGTHGEIKYRNIAIGE